VVKQIIVNLAIGGLSQAKIAELTGVSQDTLTREKKRDPDFAEALDSGRAASIGNALVALNRNVQNGVQRAIEFRLVNALNWGVRSFHEGARHGEPIRANVTWADLLRQRNGEVVNEQPAIEPE
jgi:hypothetical protein